MIEVETPKGIIEFPDGTDPSVIQAQVQKLMGFKSEAPGFAETAEADAAAMEGATVNQEGGSVVDSLLQGATMGASDEIMGGVGSVANKFLNILDTLTGTNLGMPESDIAMKDDRTMSNMYEGSKDAARSDMEQFAERNPFTAGAAEVVGGLATGGIGGAKVLGTQAIKQAPKLARMAAVPAIAAAEGATYGFNTGDSMDERLDQAVTQGATSAVLGPVLNKVGSTVVKQLTKPRARKIMERVAPTKTLDDLITTSKAFFKKADESNIRIKKGPYEKFKNELIGTIDNEGVTGAVRAPLRKSLKEIAALENPSYRDLEKAKVMLRSAKLSSDPATRTYANQISKGIDDFIGDLKPQQITGKGVKELGENLEEARSLWSSKAQLEAVDTMEDRARRSESFITDNNMDKAMRQEIRGTLNSDRKSLGLDEEVTGSLDDMLKGGFGKNRLRELAAMDPGASTARGLIPATISGGIATAVTGNPIIGILAAVAPGLTGKAARKFANSITERELSALKTAIANKNQPRIAEMMKKFAEKYGAETGGAAAGAATQISDMMVND